MLLGESKRTRTHFFFFCALTLAHLRRCAAAIRARAAALIVRGPRPWPVAFPVLFSKALARWRRLICSSMDWIKCSMLVMAGDCSKRSSVVLPLFLDN